MSAKKARFCDICGADLNNPKVRDFRRIYPKALIRNSCEGCVTRLQEQVDTVLGLFRARKRNRP